MSKSINNDHNDLRRRLASRDIELIARTRELIARSMELLRQPLPSTFLGKPRGRTKIRPDLLTQDNAARSRFNVCMPDDRARHIADRVAQTFLSSVFGRVGRCPQGV
ncbi:hypothetical protein [Bradyrhizobium sp. 141]|uniref:hypothetical protein n=1 Tax=Bradyrhizobium sp. 141 TaxID=2782617 RepID=UPI001FF85EFE|nr:hypothetical protein [Bradyrhizobium sp. 141]MCK1721318.1 hypothetical protein [Bradyrhizobium sp. 141]